MCFGCRLQAFTLTYLLTGNSAHYFLYRFCVLTSLHRCRSWMFPWKFDVGGQRCPSHSCSFSTRWKPILGSCDNPALCFRLHKILWHLEFHARPRWGAFGSSVPSCYGNCCRQPFWPVSVLPPRHTCTVFHRLQLRVSLCLRHVHHYVAYHFIPLLNVTAANEAA